MPSSARRRPGAVVLGSSYRALAVAQSLGRQAVDVTIARTNGHSIAERSRYVSRRITLAGGPEDQSRQLIELADEPAIEGAVLIPTGDDDVRMVVDHHAGLSERYRVALSAPPTVNWALDKRASYAFARRFGVEPPRTWSVREAFGLDEAAVRYPLVIKPTYRPGRIAFTTPKAWLVHDRTELKDVVQAVTALMPLDRLMVQEFIPGGGRQQLAYAALCQDGGVLASITVRRTRQWPRHFGMASSYVESIEEGDVAEPSEELLRASGFTGLIELEFKRDPRDGRLALLDVNPRAWGWISIGRRAGVDFPYLLWQMAVGQSVTRRRGRPDVRWVRMLTDVAAALSEIRAGELPLRQYFSSLRPPLTPAILARDDPVPALIDAPLIGMIAAARAVDRRRAGPARQVHRASRSLPRSGANGAGAARQSGRSALIIVENSPVPGDRRVWHEAISLRRAGWEVTVLAPHAWRDEPRAREEIIEGVRVRRFRLVPAEHRRFGHLGEYTTAMWRIWRAVRDLARERRFDVIQACNPPDFLLLAALGQRWRGTALIFDHHDLSPEMYSSRSDDAGRVVKYALLALEWLAFRMADVALATNDSVRSVALGRNRKPLSDVFVVRNGPMLQRFSPVAHDPRLARGRTHLLTYVGLMGPQDGVDHALYALARLHQRREDWHAVFLGSGEMLPALRALASELRLDGHVDFPGYVPDSEVRRAISSADVCLAPDPRNAYTDRSTLVKIAEYMALSRPVVSYDLVESRATAGGAAVFARDNSPAEFARLIEELLDDPARRETLGRAGRARVEAGLSWEHSERTLLAAYDRALEKRGR